jgi:hypothetical protein
MLVGVQLVEVVCRPNNKNSVIIFDAVDFVREKQPDLACNQAVEIFEDEQCWRNCTSFSKDLTDAGLIG